MQADDSTILHTFISTIVSQSFGSHDHTHQREDVTLFVFVFAKY